MTGSRTWAGRIALGIVTWVVVMAVALFLGLEPQPVLLALAVATVGLTLVGYLDSVASVASNSWAVVDTEAARPPGEDRRLGVLTLVVESHLSAHRVDDTLRRQLLHLLEQRLLARHGITLDADPEQVSATIGPELGALLAQRAPFPRMNIRQIDVLIERIEEL